MEPLAIKIGIGAVLTGAFHHAVASAPKKLAQVGDAIALLERKDRQVNLFRDTVANIRESRAALAGVGQELDRVKAAMQGAKGKELKALRNDAKGLEAEHRKLSRRLEKQHETMRRTGVAYREASNAANAQKASIDRLGGSLEKLRANETRLQNAIAARERAQSRFSSARAGLFAPVAAAVGLGAALKGAGQFQSVLTDIAITADLPRERISEIGSELGRLASQTGQTRAELAEGFNVLVTAGMDDDAAQKVIKTVGLTATAAGAEIGEVARTMYATVNNLKLDPTESLKAMDMLVAAGKAGSFELKDMSKYFPAMTAGASKLGMTGTKAVATLGASLQVAMDGAADPSQAATNMENFMNSLTSPETVKRFEQQGVNLEARFKRWKEKGLDPIEESMKLIQKTTGGDEFRIGELFGNKRVLSFITPMLAGMEKYKKIRAEVAAAEGMVSADAERRMKEDPALAFKMMGDSLIQLRDAAIAPLLAPMSSLFATIINGLAPVTQWMQANAGLVRWVGGAFASVTGGIAVFAGLRFGVAAAGLALNKFMTVLGVFKGAALGAVRMLPMLRGGLVFAGKAALVLGRSLLFTGKAALGLARVGLVFAGKAALVLGRSLLFTGKAALGLARVGLVLAGKAALVLGRSLLFAGKSVLLLGRALLMNPIGLMVTTIGAAAYLVYKYWEPIGRFFSGLWGGIKAGASWCWNGIKAAASWAWNGIKEAWSGVGNFFGGMWEEIKGAFSGGIAGVTKLLMDWSPLGLVYKVIASGLESLGVEMPEKFSEFGKMMMQGLVDGILGMGRAIGEAISSIASNTVGWFKSKLGIKSPSRVFVGLGSMVGEGAALGIGSTTRSVARASAALGTAATVAFAPAFASDMAAALPVLTDSVIETADTARLPLVHTAAARASAPAATSAAAPTVAQHIVFNITQQAGESGEALARRVAELIRRNERQTQRGALGDWA